MIKCDYCDQRYWLTNVVGGLTLCQGCQSYLEDTQRAQLVDNCFICSVNVRASTRVEISTFDDNLTLFIAFVCFGCAEDLAKLQDYQVTQADIQTRVDAQEIRSFIDEYLNDVTPLLPSVTDQVAKLHEQLVAKTLFAPKTYTSERYTNGDGVQMFLSTFK